MRLTWSLNEQELVGPHVGDLFESLVLRVVEGAPVHLQKVELLP